jgi:hypothetical protein
MGDLLWIGALALVYLVLKYRSDWVNQLIVAVAGKAIGKAALASQPDTVTLVPFDGPAALPQARSAIETLTQRGFTRAGSYSINEMRGLPVHFLVMARESAIAVVYEHSQAGVWTDIVCRYQDGRRFTINNARVGGGLEQPPEHISIRKPGLTTAALHLAFQRQRPQGPTLPVVAADVDQVFADAYAEEMAWRKNRGVSKEEVGSVAREMKEEPLHSDAPAA